MLITVHTGTKRLGYETRGVPYVSCSRIFQSRIFQSRIFCVPVEYHPLTMLADGSPIEFDVSGTGDDYVDFGNTLLYVKAKVTQADGTDLAPNEVVGPVNLFLHSLFSQVDISQTQR